MFWEGMDRRKFPRVMYPCMVKIISSGCVRQQILTHTENIGQYGLCIILKDEVELSTPVELEVDLLGNDENLYLKGKVVWNVQRKSVEKIKPMFYEVGIEFIEISKLGQICLREAIQLLVDKGTPLSKPYI